ncbi:unnamed protein product [Protopolystoma xenopodis]|uniref:Uncharacterized protein n=1 Tax=Protopolystoma xenopodis TaxID=117903 RepID=A0A448XK94_9PLAT|nr:unnamed protein product [Protopolystoma xenopodis]
MESAAGRSACKALDATSSWKVISSSRNHQQPFASDYEPQFGRTKVDRRRVVEGTATRPSITGRRLPTPAKSLSSMFHDLPVLFRLSSPLASCTLSPGIVQSITIVTAARLSRPIHRPLAQADANDDDTFSKSFMHTLLGYKLRTTISLVRFIHHKVVRGFRHLLICIIAISLPLLLLILLPLLFLLLVLPLPMQLLISLPAPPPTSTITTPPNPAASSSL